MRFLALALLAGCFSPQIDDGKFACDDLACPSGFHCAMCDHRCYRDPTHQCAIEPPDGAVTVDASVPPAADAPLPADAPPPPPDARLPADSPPAPDAAPPIDAGPRPDAPFCGDGTCQAWLGENCDNCQKDCKACAVTCTLQLGCGTLGNNCINCPSLCGDCVCNFVCTAADQTFCPTDCP